MSGPGRASKSGGDGRLAGVKDEVTFQASAVVADFLEFQARHPIIGGELAAPETFELHWGICTIVVAAVGQRY